MWPPILFLISICLTSDASPWSVECFRGGEDDDGHVLGPRVAERSKSPELVDLIHDTSAPLDNAERCHLCVSSIIYLFPSLDIVFQACGKTMGLQVRCKGFHRRPRTSKWDP